MPCPPRSERTPTMLLLSDPRPARKATGCHPRGGKATRSMNGARIRGALTNSHGVHVTTNAKRRRPGKGNGAAHNNKNSAVNGTAVERDHGWLDRYRVALRMQIGGYPRRKLVWNGLAFHAN